MFYYVETDLERPDMLGVNKKVLGQIKAFERAFGTVYHTQYRGGKLILFKDGQRVDEKIVLTRVERQNCALEWIKNLKEDKAYIRRWRTNLYYEEFLKTLRERNVKVVVEIPTWPYEGETYDQLAKFEDLYYREKTHEYVDCITTYGTFDEIMGISCMELANGVDLECFSKRNFRKPDENVILLTVSTLSNYQGFERIIEAMFRYYSNGGRRWIEFHIVGEGPEEFYYKQLVRDYKLEDRVKFLGVKRAGQGLEKCYDEVDIGVGAFGLYKRNNCELGSSLKLCEYCAVGLPFIYAYDDNRFSGQEIYCEKFKNNSAPIDMERVLELYDRTIDKREELANKMRKYIEKNYTWNEIMKPVIEYYRTHE